ncbi:MAG TPA: metal-sulfur cluster assembly factor [bacterium]|nr:metal-sulfur cluster assembly factor [bacterium]
MPASAGTAHPSERGGAGGSEAVTPDAVLAALAEVTDPEWPVSIVDMGLVYRVAVDGGTVTLTLTFTATACPCMEMIQDDIRERLGRVPGVRDVRIVVSWDPPWTKDRLTEKARRELARCGVTV